MTWAAVIVAAGRGTRLGGPKQFLDLAGTPMVGWSIRTFAALPQIAQIVVATEPEYLEPMRVLCTRYASRCDWHVGCGGATRQESVYEALPAVVDECEAVLVHDGARPLVDGEDIAAGMLEVRDGRAALLAAPVVDTIKRVDLNSQRVEATLDRRALWAAQTPQFARTAELRAAHEAARRAGIEATDDAALLERVGIEVVVVPSTRENFKVTLPSDVDRARLILERRTKSTAPPLSARRPETVEG